MGLSPSMWPCIALLLLCISLCCSAEERSLYIVLAEGESLAFRKDFVPAGRELESDRQFYESKTNSIVESHNELLQSTLETGTYSKICSFTHLTNGFALHTTYTQARKLRESKRVRLVQKDRGAKPMTTYIPQFLDIPEGVWAKPGRQKNTGEGIVIGFIDSGIDPLHPSFAHDPINPFAGNLTRFSGTCETGPRFPACSCNGKIVSARFFADGAQAAAILDTEKDFLSPFDAVGHGSHVASTAAGNFGVPVVVNGFFYGLASGMAPSARIAVYKAIYPSIGTLTDVLSAIDQAVKDGVDILTLSAGPDEPPEDTITFLDVFEIFLLLSRRAGVFVVQAAGNKGPGPNTVVSFSPWAVGVASCSTDRSYPATLTLGDGTQIKGVGLSGPTFGTELIQYKLVLAKDALKAKGKFPTTPAYLEECQHPEAFDPIIVLGSIVICTFSVGFLNQTSTITAIIKTTEVLGLAGFVLVANPKYGDFIVAPVPFQVPGIMIPRTVDAQMILQYYEKHTKRNKRGCGAIYGGRAAIGEGRVAIFKDRAPIVSRFSSRGPDIIDSSRNAAEVLKPDIAAPGQQVWAAWSPMSVLDPILKGNSFALLSGTSMATPQIAGIAALIKQANPSWTPSMIASAMSTTATKYDNFGETILAEGYELGAFTTSTAFDIGAGLVNPLRAMDPGLVFSPGEGEYVNFLCSLPNIDPGTVEAATGGSCNHPLSHPSDLNLPSITVAKLRGSRVVKRTVLNVQSKPETYLCSVLPPKGVTVVLSPTWFTISPYGTQSLEIKLNVTQVLSDFSFGEIVLTGSLDHIVRVSLSILPVSFS